MALRELLLGRPLRSDEEKAEEVGLWSAGTGAGLGGLASAPYGPEAALTALVPLGAFPAHHGPVINRGFSGPAVDLGQPNRRSRKSVAGLTAVVGGA